MWLVWIAELLLLCAACVAFASAAAAVYKLIDGLLTTEDDIVQYIVQHPSDFWVIVEILPSYCKTTQR